MNLSIKQLTVQHSLDESDIKETSLIIRCLRCTLFAGISGVTVDRLLSHHEQKPVFASVSYNLTSTPFVIITTSVNQKVFPPLIGAYHNKPYVQHFIVGTLAGSGVFTLWLLAALSKDWVAIESWGWKTSSRTAVLKSTTLLTLGYLSGAWNEETWFRGYGLETMRTVVGTPIATLVMSTLFALYHDLSMNPWKFQGYFTAGILLSLMKLKTQNIMFPLGYHWGWNVMQTAVFGNSQYEPSIRPITVHGPRIWVGSPGSPEPGLLGTGVHVLAGITFFAAIKLYKRFFKRDT